VPSDGASAGTTTPAVLHPAAPRFWSPPVPRALLALTLGA